LARNKKNTFEAFGLHETTKLGFYSYLYVYSLAYDLEGMFHVSYGCVAVPTNPTHWLQGVALARKDLYTRGGESIGRGLLSGFRGSTTTGRWGDPRNCLVMSIEEQFAQFAQLFKLFKIGNHVVKNVWKK